MDIETAQKEKGCFSLNNITSTAEFLYREYASAQSVTSNTTFVTANIYPQTEIQVRKWTINFQHLNQFSAQK